MEIYKLREVLINEVIIGNLDLSETNIGTESNLALPHMNLTIIANNTVKTYGGREKGTPNRLTKELRHIFQNILYNELQNIGFILNSLKPKEKIELLVKLMPLVLPYIQSINHSTNEPLDFGLD